MKFALTVLASLLCVPLAFAMGWYAWPPPTLREEVVASKFVLVGRLESDPKAPGGGTTDFVVTHVLKDDPKVKIKVGDAIRMPRLITLPDPKKPQFLVFCGIADGKPDIYRSEQYTPALLDYFTGSLAIDVKDHVKLMRQAFGYLQHEDATIADDAFATFDNSTDAEVREVGRHVDARKLRAWLQAENTKTTRRGLYSRLLAQCGDKSDAALLRKLLDKWVKNEPVTLGGVLTAYAQLDPKAGWSYTAEVLKNPDLDFNIRYSGLQAARYFHESLPGVVADAEIGAALAPTLDQNDMADLTIDSLRTWCNWSFTDKILALSSKKDFDIPIIRRAIIKYAMRCPDPKAAKFIEEARKTEPGRVEALEKIMESELCGPPRLIAAKRPDILVADFEGDAYPDGWKTTGTAFGKGPAKGTLPNQMPVTGFLGKGLVNSFNGGDTATGTLTSPAFKIERKYLNFLVGGGKHPGKTCINLLVGGKVVRTATGPNDKPGGTERLDWHSWDVAEFEGKEGVIEIVDDEKGGWGHINVDHIVQSDAKKQLEPVKRELEINTRYLHLPVKNGAPMKRVKFLVDGKTVREFDIELADDEKPDFWVFADVTDFKDKTLTVETVLVSSSKALDALKLAAEVPDPVKLYEEKHRPLFHFTSRRGWLNDPNGLVFADGEWHLFYQHNPFGVQWGNMHWGHAVSKNLVTWRELGEALYPKQYSDFAFSGSAVVDNGNTSGWGIPKTEKVPAKPAMVLAYTSTGRGECIAYSTDKGRTWTEYDKNPVVKHSGRDPKLVWYEKGKHWVMAVYDEFEKKQWIAFYTSPDLKTWTFASRIEGFFECPDLFPLDPADPSKIATKEKWVLYAADGKYLVGEFDGKEFKPDFKEKKQLWFGNFYAAQTFDNAPKLTGPGFSMVERHRRVQIGWANGVTFPGMPFNQQMTVPVELTLRDEKDGPRLLARPVSSQESLRDFKPANDKPFVGEVWLTDAKTGQLRKTVAEGLDAFDMVAALKLEPTANAKQSTVAFSLRGTELLYDLTKKTLTCKGVSAPVPLHGGKLILHVLVDRGSVEVFADGGRVAMSIAAIPGEKNSKLEISASGTDLAIETLEVWRMQSAWEK